MLISDHTIGNGEPPFIVAEIGANHGGNLDAAKRLIEAARGCGADAVKFQAYTADTITLDCRRDEFLIKDGPWQGYYLHDLYTRCATPFDWFPQLAAHAKELGIIWFASVFDRSSVDMLEKLDCPAYKIASFELVDLPLIKYAAATGKPMILSTGMASEEEIDDALRAAGQDVALLHCVSAYPTPIASANLERMQKLHSYFPHVGISDHTIGNEVAIAATALGACIIEKHLALSRAVSVDAAFSLAPHEFRGMVTAVRSIFAALQPSTSDEEDAHRSLRRSLFAVRDIAAREQFTNDNVRSIRPGNGMAPSELPHIIGKHAAYAIARGTPLHMSMID